MMDDPSALMQAAQDGDAESLRRLLLLAQRPLRVTAAIFLPTLVDVDAVVQELTITVVAGLAEAPVTTPLPWLRGLLRTLITARMAQESGAARNPLRALALQAGRERLATVPVDADPVPALQDRLRWMAKGATDLLLLRFAQGLPVERMAAQRAMSVDNLCDALQTACRQLDWTGDASGGGVDAELYRMIDGMVCPDEDSPPLSNEVGLCLRDDPGLRLRAVRAARLHLIAAAWHAPELTVRVPALIRPTLPAPPPAPPLAPPPAPLAPLPSAASPTPTRRQTHPLVPPRPSGSRGASTPTRRQLALKPSETNRAARLEDYEEHPQRSGLIATLIAGAMVLGAVALMVLRGGTTAVTTAPTPTPVPIVNPVSAPVATAIPAPAQINIPPIQTKTLFTATFTPLPLAAWSTRRLVAGYSGPLLRVRRNGDQAESDVGFTADGALDTAALTSFTRLSSAHVVAWYDQSGNQHHLRQKERDQQPRIIVDGTLQTENSRTVIVFDRSRFDHLSTPAGIPIGCLYALVKVVQRGDGTQGIMGSMSNVGVESDAYYPIVDRSGKGTCEWWAGQTKDYTILTVPITRGRLLLWHSSLGGDNRRQLTLCLDGKEVARGTASYETLVPVGPTVVGGLYWAHQLGDPFGGSLGELIVLPPDSSNEVRSTITKDLKEWWKTP